MNKPPQYQSREGQKFSGFVRAHLAVIEAEQAAGIKLDQILADIHGQTNFKDANLDTFKNAIWRARRWVNEGKALPAQADGDNNSQAAGTSAAPTATAAEGQSVSGVKFAHVQKKSFGYQPPKAGQDMSHILGTTDKAKK